MNDEFGRDGSPEEQAEAIMNSSDESLDDLMEGTEINEGDEDLDVAEPEFEEDLESFEE